MVKWGNDFCSTTGKPSKAVWLKGAVNLAVGGGIILFVHQYMIHVTIKLNYNKPAKRVSSDLTKIDSRSEDVELENIRVK